MNRFSSRFLSIVCIIVSFVAIAERAAAAVLPYAARGTAHFVSPTDFVGSGQATHLGRYSEAGRVAFTPTGNPAVLHVEGSIVYTAANGDELHATVSGELNGATGAISATVTYSGGTGRFANATGSGALSGQLDAQGVISVSVDGSVQY